MPRTRVEGGPFLGPIGFSVAFAIAVVLTPGLPGSGPRILVHRIYDSGTPYDYFGDYLEQQLRELGRYDVEGRPTTGSFQTLLQIESLERCRTAMETARADECDGGPTAGIGIVQADVLFHYLNGEHPQFPFGKEESP